MVAVFYTLCTEDAVLTVLKPVGVEEHGAAFNLTPLVALVGIALGEADIPVRAQGQERKY